MQVRKSLQKKTSIVLQGCYKERFTSMTNYIVAKATVFTAMSVQNNSRTNVTGVYNRLVYDDMEKCMMEHSYFASVSQNNSKQGS